MLVVVSYDVAEDEGGKRRLRRIAKLCESYGQRVQYSVFECVVDPAQWLKLKTKLENEFDPNYDSLRYYKLGSNYEKRIEHVGAKNIETIQSDPLIL